MHPAPAHFPLYPFLFATLLLLLAFGGAFFLLWYYFKKTRRPVSSPAAAGGPTDGVILSLRLQACERLVLFLERIHPSNLVMRLNNPDLTAAQLQTLLVRTIREEFEYNLSQQLYVSGQSWEQIKNAKEEAILLINHAASALPEQAGSAGLVKQIFALVVERGKLPVEKALEGLKEEVQRIF